MKTNFIYALVDPRTDEVRYVGKTVDLKRRMRRHRNIGRSENPSLYRDRWIQSLMDDGLDFIVWILDSCDDDNWTESERNWIKYFKDEGCNLTNLTNGGDGWYKYKMTEKHREALCKPKPAGFGEKISKIQKEVIANRPDLKKIRSENGKKNKGRKHSLKTREKVSKAVKDRWKSLDYREKMKKSFETSDARAEMSRRASLNKGVPKSQLTKERMSETAKKRPKTPCEVCGKEYTVNNMVIHMRTYHTKVLV